MTANTERGGQRGEGCGRGAAIHSALADPDDQRAIMRTAYARTGRAGPHPDRNAHHLSVRLPFLLPAGWQRLLKRIAAAMPPTGWFGRSLNQHGSPGWRWAGQHPPEPQSPPQKLKIAVKGLITERHWDSTPGLIRPAERRT
jgi:hypothetical protein